MYTVNANDSLEGWRKGVEYLYSNGECYHLLTTIENPTKMESSWFDDYNPANVRLGIPSISDVATTIFPYKYLNRGYSRTKLFNRYANVHARAKKLHKKSGRRWGTYFERMIQFGPNQINQLEKVTTALLNWKNNPRAALVLHISSPDTDSPKPIGAPCLQYVAILCPDRDTISLLSVYRNHDYFEKVLGNFIGLGQLLKFLCCETGRNPGTLTCHSAHAYYHSNKSEIKNLARL